MRFLKGVLAGVISLVVGAVVISFLAILALRFIPSLKGRSHMAFDLVAMSQSHVAWFVAVALFLFGFFGELRRN
jgi:hypothetical protein